MDIQSIAENTGKKTVIYARISRDLTGEGEGIQRQEEACERLAKSLGLEVSHVYTDNDIGASNKTGIETQTAVSRHARRGPIRHSQHNQHLHQQPPHAKAHGWIEFISLAESGKLQIRTVTSGSHDLTTADGRAVALTVAAWDAVEADRISERQKITFERNALVGKPKLQRQRAFGWDEDGITIREPEATLIRQAVGEIKAGATIASIRHRWNSEGIKTAVDPDQSKKETKPDGQWELSVVQRLLLGWRTAGLRTRHRKPLRDAEGQQLVMGTWDPIISLQDRDQALAALNRHARTKLRTGSWTLAGLVRCGECSKPTYWQLPTGTRSRATYSCKDGRVGISAGLLEQHLIREAIIRAIRPLENGAAEATAKPRQAADWLGNDRLTRVKEKITELMDAYTADQPSGGIAFAQVDKLGDERCKLQRELDELLIEETPPASPLRSTSEALEWLQSIQGQFLRITPSKAKSTRTSHGEKMLN